MAIAPAMKKTTAVLSIAFAGALGLSACGSQSSSTTATATASASASATASASASARHPLRQPPLQLPLPLLQM